MTGFSENWQYDLLVPYLKGISVLLCHFASGCHMDLLLLMLTLFFKEVYILHVAAIMILVISSISAFYLSFILGIHLTKIE